MNFFPRAALFLSLLACSARLALADQPKIGVLLKGTTDFWNLAEQKCRAAAQASGYQLIARKPLSEVDVDGQIKLLSQFESEGISALIIAPCSSTALAAPVAAFAARGVKIVVVDSPLDLDTPVYIATNHTDSGVAAGQLLASLVGDHDEVSILRHTRTGGATLLRESSAYATIFGAHPGIVIDRDVFAGAVPGQEAKFAAELLQRHPHTKGILASSTPVTMAMLQVLQSSGRAGSIKFVGFGFNLNPAIAAALESGAMSGWIAQLPSDIANRGVASAIALMRGQSVPEVIYCPFFVITKDNLHTPAIQGLLPTNQTNH